MKRCRVRGGKEGVTMTPRKILEVVSMYEKRLVAEGVPKKRISPGLSFGVCNTQELLAHAHYLCDGLKDYAQDPQRQGKANRHLTAIQMCLSFANWYTLAQLMEHIRTEEVV